MNTHKRINKVRDLLILGMDWKWTWNWGLAGSVFKFKWYLSNDIPRMSLTCKLVPVQYRGFKQGLFSSHFLVSVARLEFSMSCHKGFRVRNVTCYLPGAHFISTSSAIQFETVIVTEYRASYQNIKCLKMFFIFSSSFSSLWKSMLRPQVNVHCISRNIHL